MSPKNEPYPGFPVHMRGTMGAVSKAWFETSLFETRMTCFIYPCGIFRNRVLVSCIYKIRVEQKYLIVRFSDHWIRLYID